MDIFSALIVFSVCTLIYKVYNSKSFDNFLYGYSSNIGNVQIWQHNSKNKGEWQKAYVLYYDKNESTYRSAHFDDNVDFVTPSKSRTNFLLTWITVQVLMRSNYKRYSDEDIKKYKSSYGL